MALWWLILPLLLEDSRTHSEKTKTVRKQLPTENDRV